MNSSNTSDSRSVANDAADLSVRTMSLYNDDSPYDAQDLSEGDIKMRIVRLRNNRQFVAQVVGGAVLFLLGMVIGLKLRH